MTTLVIADHHNGEYNPATAHVVTAATQMGGDIHVLVAGEGIGPVAEKVATIEGVSKVLSADDAVYVHTLAEPLADLVLSLADQYDAVLALANTNGKNFMPRVAALLDVEQVSDIISVVSADEFTRPIYAGNAIAQVKVSEPKKIITVRGTAFDAAGEQGACAIESVSGNVSNDGSAFVGEELAQSDRPELTSARVVISGGRGLGSGENFAILDGIADSLGAAIGASRAAVDAGFVPNDMQVGQTGKVVAPDLYIAVGISGQIQHLAGMKDSKVIVAINKDEDAPIFQVADYGLVADLFEAVPALENALK